MTHLFIINPAAGSHNQVGEYREKIKQTCEAKGLSYGIEVSAYPGNCAELARAAAETGEDLRIYSCGGDGTMNEILSGVAGCDNVAVTMFAGGSGNDFIRIFDNPMAFRDLEALTDSEETVFDLIDCNGRICLNIASVGFDSRIAADVSNYKRLPMLSGFRAYAVSAGLNIIKGIQEHYRVEINGECSDRNFSLICVCNGQYYGGGFHPVPEADPTDGVLEVLLVNGISRFKVAELIGKYKNGLYAQMPDLIRRVRTTELTIHADRPVPINLDGEIYTDKDIHIQLSQKKIRFFYPRITKLQSSAEGRK